MVGSREREKSEHRDDDDVVVVVVVDSWTKTKKRMADEERDMHERRTKGEGASLTSFLSSLPSSFFRREFVCLSLSQILFLSSSLPPSLTLISASACESDCECSAMLRQRAKQRASKDMLPPPCLHL